MTGDPAHGTGRRALQGGGTVSGFTLIELLIVIAIVAISAAVVTLSLRDRDATRLEEEGERLSALLEMARAEARVAGVTVRWLPSAGLDESRGAPGADAAAQFRFVGLPSSQSMPTRWLDASTSAQVVGGTALVLGPEAILPAQRVVLRLGERRLELASDGLAPFAAANAVPEAAQAAAALR